MAKYFNEKLPWEIREQILNYNSTINMSDSERAEFLGLAKGCRIREGAKILSPNNLKIGENCWIGENAILDASGGLEIGSNTSIGLGVFIWTHDSFSLNIRGKNTREFSHLIKRTKTKIGSNCFVAGPSVIMPGVKIGDKCVISPMSVVTEDLPAKTIYRPYIEFLEVAKSLNTKNDRIDNLEKRLNELERALRGTVNVKANDASLRSK